MSLSYDTQTGALPSVPDARRPASGEDSCRVAPMRLMFLCNSLEPGRDGVGDYTRLLVEQCRMLSLECCVVALNDGHVTQAEESIGRATTKELRLPATMPWPERVARVTALRQSFQPDRISLQFVPYGLNSKGVVWGLSRFLRDMAGRVRWHVMFHELWIGASRTDSWKSRAMGKLQQVSILRLLRMLKPDSIATSNATYAGMIESCGVRARKLTLFGNIPIADPEVMAPSMARAMIAAKVSWDASQRDGYWVGAFFGTLHPEWEAEPLFSTIHRAATAVGRRVCLVAVGRLGAAGERKWAAMADRYGTSFSFVALGEQEPRLVSGLLQEADFGIAASPWRLIGKSGSAIAMLEHGLPVIANRDDWHPRHVEVEEDAPDPLLHRCDGLLEGKLIAGLPKRMPGSGVQESARQFVQSLGAGAA
jgi:hypothetical protein